MFTNRGVKNWSKLIGSVCSHNARTLSFSDSGTACTGDMYLCDVCVTEKRVGGGREGVEEKEEKVLKTS